MVGRNANLSHLFEVRSAYQRVFPAHRTQPACHYAGERRGEERRGEERRGEERSLVMSRTL